MPDMRPRVTENTYYDLRLASAEFQRELKRRITISELITAAWQVTKNHPDELRQILASNK
jgi:hypothetical protein